MYQYMNVCIRTRKYMSMYVYTHVHEHGAREARTFRACMHSLICSVVRSLTVDTYVYIYIYIYICIYIYIYIYMYMYIYIYRLIDVQKRTTHGNIPHIDSRTA